MFEEAIIGEFLNTFMTWGAGLALLVLIASLLQPIIKGRRQSPTSAPDLQPAGPTERTSTGSDQGAGLPRAGALTTTALVDDDTPKAGKAAADPPGRALSESPETAEHHGGDTDHGDTK